MRRAAPERSRLTRGLLPGFLGIGAPRAGTTWLHDLLSAHPDACLPTVRKELDYFNLHHHRGVAWYAGCFVPKSGSTPSAVGEISPVYMYSDEVRKRVAALGTVDRFVVCLRDPVDLLWSGYKQNAAIYDFRGDLDEFMEMRPDVVDNGRYARALRPWFDDFGRDAFLVLRSDRMFADVGATKAVVGEFLGLDPARFPADAGGTRVNESFAPRFRRTYGWSKRTVARMDRAGLSGLIGLAKRTGAKRVVARRGSDDRVLSDERRAALRELYRHDLVELEDLIGEDLSSWINPS